ncbi:MAG: ABC transporter ATP-binding protein [Smithellaceae bacterium]|nr:ABC transporter ATP-binding protein [Syntrophaceae bacterium]MDD4239932.1 ABC transporter ATP-binding protein [Smithellaceae bacterium]NLX51595.1 ABC transporter ATP-binding protein [Deltaproteobacteria bacterium]
MNILETKDLKHSFGPLAVLFGVDLQIEEGERHAVIGPNGAGKTTLFNTITGTYHPTSGRVFFKGKDITGYKPYKLARIGIGRSFQITSTFTNLTAFQNIRLAILSKDGVRFNLLRPVEKMKKITEETDEMLKRINLYDDRNTPAASLSYGKSRALEISMALATNPELVLLDEFAAGMSKEETADAVALIRKLTEGKTVVIIEHDMDVVFSLADRITVLHYGKILATGKPEEIRNNQAVKDAYLGDLEV